MCVLSTAVCAQVISSPASNSFSSHQGVKDSGTQISATLHRI